MNALQFLYQGVKISLIDEGFSDGDYERIDLVYSWPPQWLIGTLHLTLIAETSQTVMETSNAPAAAGPGSMLEDQEGNHGLDRQPVGKSMAQVKAEVSYLSQKPFL